MIEAAQVSLKQQTFEALLLSYNMTGHQIHCLHLCPSAFVSLAKLHPRPCSSHEQSDRGDWQAMPPWIMMNILVSHCRQGSWKRKLQPREQKKRSLQPLRQSASGFCRRLHICGPSCPSMLCVLHQIDASRTATHVCHQELWICEVIKISDCESDINPEHYQPMIQ